MSNTRHFGRIVRAHREREGMSLRRAADLCDMSEKGIELIELGDSDPKLSSVLKIAAVYNIDLGELNSCIPALY